MENYLAVPVLIGKKTESEKFAGALSTSTLEALMPDGKALQMGTSHNLGQNFSKAFNIKFVGEDEKEHYVWQTSWGITTRLIGAVIMVHGDDKGAILPPKIAPVQTVIVPIPYKVDKKDVQRKAIEVLHILKERLISVVLDDRPEYTPGWKFNEWELKGVPLRVEIGPRDLERGEVTLARRDISSRIRVKEEKVGEEVELVLGEIQKNILERARKFLADHTLTVKTYEEFKRIMKSEGGFIKASWCSGSKCEREIKEETGATIRLIPFKKEEPFSSCVYCGAEGQRVVYFGRAY
jgi:prolyl-tRNA synthetase